MKLRTKTIGLAAVAVAVCVAIAGAAQAAVVDLTPDAQTVAQWDFSSDLSVTCLGTNVAGASDVSWTLTDDDNSGHSGGDAPRKDGQDYVDNGNNPLINGDPEPTGSGRVFARRFQNIEEDFFAFDVTIESGFVLNLQDVVADFGFRQNAPKKVRVVYSTTSDFSSEVFIGGGDSFVADEADADMGYGADGNFNVVPPSKGKFSWNRYVHNENLAGDEQLEGTVYFRVYAEEDPDNFDAGENNFYMKNLTIRGEVIPEPATLGLLGIGGLAALLRRRGS